MSQKIADFFAKIWADASGFYSELNKTKGGLSELKSEVTTAMTTVGAITGVMIGAGAAVKKLADEYVAYTDEVADMSRITGMGVEETSRLIQAADDMFISQQTLQSGLEFAIRKGYEPSVQWLGQMADKIMAIPDPATRAKTAIEIFGRQAGPEMMKMMEQGAKGIDTLTQSVADNLVVTEQSRLKAIEYKKAVDQISDAWHGLVYEIGPEVLDFLTMGLKLTSFTADVLESIADKTYSFDKVGHLLANYLPSFAAILPDATQNVDDFGTALDNAGTSSEDLEAQLETLRKELIDQTGWEKQFSTLDTVKEKYTSMTDFLGDKLQGLSAQGGEVWNAFLVATGEITPEAARVFIEMERLWDQVKAKIEAGVSTDVIVNYIITQTGNIQAGGSVTQSMMNGQGGTTLLTPPNIHPQGTGSTIPGPSPTTSLDLSESSIRRLGAVIGSEFQKAPQ